MQLSVIWHRGYLSLRCRGSRLDEEEEFYMLDIPSLDSATSDASRVRFWEYPRAVGDEPTSLAILTPAVRRSLLSFLLSRQRWHSERP